MCHIDPFNCVNDVFCPADYYKSMASKLWLLREQNLYCDFEIECENQIINAHRIIVAAGMEYFRHLLGSNMAESISKRVKLNVGFQLKDGAKVRLQERIVVSYSEKEEISYFNTDLMKNCANFWFFAI
jgi:hypothetical protein